MRVSAMTGVIHSDGSGEPVAQRAQAPSVFCRSSTRPPGIRPPEIAIAQDVHPSQVTRQVRELENLGFAQITADTVDKRSCRVTLTSVGTDELQSLTEQGLDRFASFVGDWKPEEVQMLTSLLQKLERC
jgi:DNA-binding MarR family transcriptional regulator